MSTNFTCSNVQVPAEPLRQVLLLRPGWVNTGGSGEQGCNGHTGPRGNENGKKLLWFWQCSHCHISQTHREGMGIRESSTFILSRSLPLMSLSLLLLSGTKEEPSTKKKSLNTSIYRVLQEKQARISFSAPGIEGKRNLAVRCALY